MKHGKSLPTPAGARRVTKPDKTRVWLFDGMEFRSKRELYAYYSPEARMAREKAAELEKSKQVSADGAE
jgi:hypothetical protein